MYVTGFQERSCDGSFGRSSDGSSNGSSNRSSNGSSDRSVTDLYPMKGLGSCAGSCLSGHLDHLTKVRLDDRTIIPSYNYLLANSTGNFNVWRFLSQVIKIFPVSYPFPICDASPNLEKLCVDRYINLTIFSLPKARIFRYIDYSALLPGCFHDFEIK